MKTQHGGYGALVRCDYNEMLSWRFSWFFKNLKYVKVKHPCYFCQKPDCKQSTPTLWQMVRCGIFAEHRYVRTLKLFFTSMECIETNRVDCNNPVCPRHKYIVEQWGQSNYKKRCDFKDESGDILTDLENDKRLEKHIDKITERSME